MTFSPFFGPLNCTLPYPLGGYCQPKSAYNPNIASGDVDLYTCPTGRKALIYALGLFNPTIGAITYISQLVIGATRYRISANNSLGPGAHGNTLGANTTVLLNATDKFGVNTTALGLNITVAVIEFDMAFPIQRAQLLALTGGTPDTLYTCPPGKTAVPFVLSAVPQITSGLYSNASGAGRTIAFWQVPSGGTAGDTNKVLAATPANNAIANPNLDAPLAAGDKLQIQSDAGTATQIVWANILEL